MTKTAYSPVENTWSLDWPGRIKQHDIVFKMPPDDPTQGLAIGNGNIGSLIWTQDSRLIMTVNKNDAFDDREPGEFTCDAEGNSTLRHCGRVELDFSVPVFHSWYQKDFAARLNLDDATAEIHARTPFCSVDILSYGSFGKDVIVLTCQVESEEKIPVKITLERWGTRMFTRWYYTMGDDSSTGLAGTETRVDDNAIILRQKLRTLDFVTAILVDDVKTVGKRLHSRAGQLETEPGTKRQFTLYLTVVTSENAQDPEKKALELLYDAKGMGEPEIRRRHAEEWKSFWNASFLSIPDKYIENIWYFILYLNNSSSRGNYPPHFINGLWNFNQDFLPWANYFHWNMQNYSWSLHTANHSELAVPYLNYRYNQLPHAIHFAEKYKGKKGAFYADVADRRGYNCSQVKDNNTPGSQIALFFWKHFCYTGDRVFLKEMAWPVIREAARFYADMVEKLPDGKYHIFNTQTYEGSPMFDDSITDVAMIKALFPVAVEAAKLEGCEGEETAHWMDIRDNTVEFKMVPMMEEEYTMQDGQRILASGLGKGNPCQTDMVYAGGKYRTLEGVEENSDNFEDIPDYVVNGIKGSEKGSYLRCRYAHKDGYYGIPDAELAVIYPSGVIGLKDRDTEQFHAAVNQVRIHPPSEPGRGESGGMDLKAKLCHGWCPYPVALARLGLGEELSRELAGLVSVFQCYPNGFGQWGPFPGFINDRDQRWGKWWKFRHFGNETLNMVCAALNEMLIQSYEGVIRLCPAVPGDWDTRFKLAAEGGFLVNLEMAQGEVTWACVESTLGKECALVVPWPRVDTVYMTPIDQQGNVACEVELCGQTEKADTIIRFPTQKGHRYLISCRKNALADSLQEAISFQQNEDCKKLGYAMLGLPKLY